MNRLKADPQNVKQHNKSDINLYGLGKSTASS